MKTMKFIGAFLFAFLLFTGVATKAHAYTNNYSIYACSQPNGTQKYSSSSSNIVINNSTIRFFTKDYRGRCTENIYLDGKYLGKSTDISDKIYFADIKEVGDWMLRAFDVKNISKGQHTLKIIALSAFDDRYVDTIHFTVE